MKYLGYMMELAIAAGVCYLIHISLQRQQQPPPVQFQPEIRWETQTGLPTQYPPQAQPEVYRQYHNYNY